MRLLLLLSLVASPLMAAERFVSPQGSDDGDGSEGKPWQSLAHAVTQLKAGDTLLLANGKYQGPVKVEASGSGEHPIVIRAKEAQKAVVLAGETPAGQSILTVSGASHLRIRDLRFRGGEARVRAALRVEGSGRGVRISGCRFENIDGRSAVDAEGNSGAPLQRLGISDNEVVRGELSPEGAAIRVRGNVDGFEVMGNHVRDGAGNGIRIGLDRRAAAGKSPRNGVCGDNWIYRRSQTRASGIALGGVRNVTVENNLVSLCGTGIHLGDTGGGAELSSVVLRNNKVFGNRGPGFLIGEQGEDVRMIRRCVVEGNVSFRNTVDADLSIGEISLLRAEGNRIVNNVVVSRRRGVLVWVGSEAGENRLNGNRYHSPVGYADAAFHLRGTDSSGLDSWREATGWDGDSRFGVVEVVLPTLPARGGEVELP